MNVFMNQTVFKNVLTYKVRKPEFLENYRTEIKYFIRYNVTSPPKQKSRNLCTKEILKKFAIKLELITKAYVFSLAR